MQTVELFKKEVVLEFRQKHSLAGVLLFVLSSSFICYLSFGELPSESAWSALLWLIGLFSAFHAMARTFSSEGAGTQLYLYSLAHPRAVIFSKSIFNALLVALLNVLAFLLFILFFGTEAIENADFGQLIVGVMLGSTGLGIALTLVAGIAYKASQNLSLMAILAFPLVIPLLMTLVNFSVVALSGRPWEENLFHLMVLLVINASSLILSIILFPYLWRD